MNQKQPATIRRNISIFYVGTLLLAVAGGFIQYGGQDVGSLLFILSPLIMVLVARILLRDGWGDAGLRLSLRGNGRWYLFALLLYPVLFPLVVFINTQLGWTTVDAPLPALLPLVLGGFAAQFIPRMLFSLSEEWAWRGYLEPRLAMLGTPDMQRHIAVGLLWAIWHLPLILTTPYTNSPIIVFLLLFIVGVVLMALVFGRMRTATGSVWPAVLLHGMGNALGFALLDHIVFDSDILGGLHPATLVVMLVWAGIAWLIWRRRPVPAN